MTWVTIHLFGPNPLGPPELTCNFSGQFLACFKPSVSLLDYCCPRHFRACSSTGAPGSALWEQLVTNAEWELVGLCPNPFVPSYVNSEVYSKHFLIFFGFFLITCFVFPTPSFMFPVFTSQVSYPPQAPTSESAFEGTLKRTHSIGLCWVHPSLCPWPHLLLSGDMKCYGPNTSCCCAHWPVPSDAQVPPHHSTDIFVELEATH